MCIRDRGHTIVGVEGGFTGLCEGRVRELTLRDVEGCAGRGGAEPGTRREELGRERLYAVARAIETHLIDGLLLVGGFDAYRMAHRCV